MYIMRQTCKRNMNSNSPNMIISPFILCPDYLNLCIHRNFVIFRGGLLLNCDVVAGDGEEKQVSPLIEGI